MIGGFALAAAPADYRVTGVKTFIVSYEGIVYQKDLGPDTLKIFRGMELYNPDKTWKPTDSIGLRMRLKRRLPQRKTDHFVFGWSHRSLLLAGFRKDRLPVFG